MPGTVILTKIFDMTWDLDFKAHERIYYCYFVKWE